MPDLDLEPKDYRAQPLKGERVFAPGGLKRLAIYAAFVVGMLALGAVWQPIAYGIVSSVRTLVGG